MTTLRTIKQLSEKGLIAVQDAEHGAKLDAVAARYSIALSEAVVETISPVRAVDQPILDPVARQYVPSVEELVPSIHDRADPIGDEVHSPLPGLVHRYPDRVLIKATAVCPVYCRFCFRREMVGGNAERPLTDEQFRAIFTYVAAHSEIWEVIISGGDPLVLSDARLQALLDGLAESTHVRVIRFHTRVPVVNPQRITDKLARILRSTDKTVYIAVHANHANEFSQRARAACARLVDAGVPLISQSVLLAGVNDSETTLGELMRTFVELRITPYYLHQLDLAPGTEHFRVSVERGQQLLRSLRGTYSGLCQPNYVIDLPGGFGKVSIGPNYVRSDEQEGNQANSIVIEDIDGQPHSYPPACPEALKQGKNNE